MQRAADRSLEWRLGTYLGGRRSQARARAGMRERVTLLGGTFPAGLAPGGGFEVAAELPTGERR
jgi:glucose-6-phosphate-specific signal transduction histidine kinase